MILEIKVIDPRKVYTFSDSDENPMRIIAVSEEQARQIREDILNGDDGSLI